MESEAKSMKGDAEAKKKTRAYVNLMRDAGLDPVEN
jgi:hypothetical protein